MPPKKNKATQHAYCNTYYGILRRQCSFWKTPRQKIPSSIHLSVQKPPFCARTVVYTYVVLHCIISIHAHILPSTHTYCTQSKLKGIIAYAKRVLGERRCPHLPFLLVFVCPKEKERALTFRGCSSTFFQPFFTNSVISVFWNPPSTHSVKKPGRTPLVLTQKGSLFQHHEMKFSTLPLVYFRRKKLNHFSLIWPL